MAARLGAARPHSRGLLNRLDCGSYAELHRLSVADPERFGPELVADLGLEFS